MNETRVTLKCCGVVEHLDEAHCQLHVAAAELLEALKKHVCVKAISGDGMNKVDYYPVEADDCELCKAVAKVDGKPGIALAKVLNVGPMKDPDLNLKILDWALAEQMAGRSPATPDIATAFKLSIEQVEEIQKELEEAGEFE